MHNRHCRKLGAAKGNDCAVHHLAIRLLRDEEAHLLLFESYLAELEQP